MQLEILSFSILKSHLTPLVEFTPHMVPVTDLFLRVLVAMPPCFSSYKKPYDDTMYQFMNLYELKPKEDVLLRKKL
jgi:hypothetical protein